MTQPKPPSTADLVDQLMQRTALGVFLLALVYGSAVFTDTVNELTAIYLRYLRSALSIAIVLLVLPAFWRFRKLRGKHRAGCSNPESFVVEMFRRAALIAFSSSFVLLVALDIITRKQIALLSASQIINALLCFMLVVFSISFYVLSRVDGAEDGESEFDDEEPRT